jgi:putative solute:sodium symporter small subunit
MANDTRAPDIGQKYWHKTSQLMRLVLIVWACLGFGVPLLANCWNDTVIFGFPLGYFMAAQGSLIGFVLLIFWYVRRQNRIDEDFHLAED